MQQSSACGADGGCCAGGSVGRALGLLCSVPNPTAPTHCRASSAGLSWGDPPAMRQTLQGTSDRVTGIHLSHYRPGFPFLGSPELPGAAGVTSTAGCLLPVFGKVTPADARSAGLQITDSHWPDFPLPSRAAAAAEGRGEQSRDALLCLCSCSGLVVCTQLPPLSPHAWSQPSGSFQGALAGQGLLLTSLTMQGL